MGFAKIALEAQVPIIPVFTRNIREAVRTLVPNKKLVKAVYNRFRIPCALTKSFKIYLQIGE